MIDWAAAPASSSSVRATTSTRSQQRPFEMKVLLPLMTHSSPSRTARVLMPWRSEPVPGSDIAMAPMASPEAILGSHAFLRCSSA